MNISNKSYRLKPMKQKQLIHQVVQEEMKAYIINNSLGPGDPLPTEGEIAKQLSISRTSVREAIKGLEALGVVETRAGTGIFVRDFSFDPILDNLAYGILYDIRELDEILEVRALLEISLTEYLISSKTPAQLERMKEILEQIHIDAEVGIYSSEADRDFHKALHQNLDNATLKRLLDIFWEIYYAARINTSIPDPRNPLETYERHVGIVKALEIGDSDELRSALSEHYIGIKTRINKLSKVDNGLAT